MFLPVCDETPWAITRTATMLPTNFAVSWWHDVVRRPGDGAQNHEGGVGARQSYNVVYFTRDICRGMVFDAGRSRWERRGKTGRHVAYKPALGAC